MTKNKTSNGSNKESIRSIIPNLPKPNEIKEKLDKYIIGQDECKKIISVAVYNHFKRIALKDNKYEDVHIDKSNILLLGPTGTGKTLIAKVLAETFNVPFAIVDATSLTQAGYVGDDVENILLQLLINADFDIERCECGIIYVDEIDKVAKRSAGVSVTRDVSGEGVQQALLKIAEGTISSVPQTFGRKHPGRENILINTKNILFVCGGAFSGIEDVVKSRMHTSKIGFNCNHEKEDVDYWKHVTQKDLMNYGFIREFIGRFPIVTQTSELTYDQLIQILKEPKNAIIKQYQALLDMDDIELVFTDCALKSIASIAVEKEIGARGLRSVIDGVMGDIMFDAPRKSCEYCRVIVDESVVLGKEKPKYIKRDMESEPKENKEKLVI